MHPDTGYYKNNHSQHGMMTSYIMACDHVMKWLDSCMPHLPLMRDRVYQLGSYCFHCLRGLELLQTAWCLCGVLPTTSCGSSSASEADVSSSGSESRSRPVSAFFGTRMRCCLFLLVTPSSVSTSYEQVATSALTSASLCLSGSHTLSPTANLGSSLTTHLLSKFNFWRSLSWVSCSSKDEMSGSAEIRCALPFLFGTNFAYMMARTFTPPRRNCQKMLKMLLVTITACSAHDCLYQTFPEKIGDRLI